MIQLNVHNQACKFFLHGAPSLYDLIWLVTSHILIHTSNQYPRVQCSPGTNSSSMLFFLHIKSSSLCEQFCSRALLLSAGAVRDQLHGFLLSNDLTKGIRKDSTPVSVFSLHTPENEGVCGDQTLQIFWSLRCRCTHSSQLWWEATRIRGEQLLLWTIANKRED